MTIVRHVEKHEDAVIDAMLGVMRVAFEDDLDPAAMRTQFIKAWEINGVRAIVALENNKVIGACVLRYFYDALCPRPGIELTNIAVLPEHQDKGVATRMIDFAKAEGLKGDFAFLRVIVGAGADVLVEYYKKRGFTSPRTGLLHYIESGK